MSNSEPFTFRSVLPRLIACIDSKDEDIHQATEAVLTQMYHAARPDQQAQFFKQMQNHSRSKDTQDRIMSGSSVQSAHNTPSATFASNLRPVINREPSHRPGSADSTQTGEIAQQPQTTRKVLKTAKSTSSIRPTSKPTPSDLMSSSISQVEPLYVESLRELEDVFREMQPFFEGKESEQNWLPREKSVIKLRRIIAGNTSEDFALPFIANIRQSLDGILKTVNSLRTTLSTKGCELLQDLARKLGSGIDPMVEILLQNLIKLCANTKKIAAANGNVTVSAIVGHVSYHMRLMQHIWAAAQDKNVQPRIFCPGWLNIVLQRHGKAKSLFEHGGGLELVEKTIKSGLADRDPHVRESMRPTFWTFASVWPPKSEAIMSSLDQKQAELLLKDPANPGANQPSSFDKDQKIPAFSQSTSAVSNRPSIKDTIAQNRAAKARGLPERPGSAEPKLSPPKKTQAPTASRNTTTSSNLSVVRPGPPPKLGSMSSAPVRPVRPGRKPETTREQQGGQVKLADVSSERKPSRGVAPSATPAARRPQKRPVTPAGPPASARFAANAPKSARSTPEKTKKQGKPVDLDQSAPHEHSPVNTPTGSSPTKSAEDFTMILPRQANENMPFNQPLPQVFSPKAADPERSSPTKADIPLRAMTNSQLNSPAKSVFSPPVHASSNSNTPTAPLPQRTPSPKKLEDYPRIECISISPRDPKSKKENMPPRTSPQRPSKLQVFEDQGYVQTPPAQSLNPTALEELPINGSDPFYKPVSSSEAWGRKPFAQEEKTESPYKARKMLDSAILSLQQGRLDAHAYRKLQYLIQKHKDIFDDAVKYDQLLLPLLDQLESSSNTIEQISSVIVTVRKMLPYKDLFKTYTERTLCAVLMAREHVPASSHVICSMEDTIEELVTRCKPVSGCAAILDLLETQSISDLAKPMALFTIAGLLHNIMELKKLNYPVDLDDLTQHRLALMIRAGINDAESDVRRAAVELVVCMLKAVKDDAKVWAMLDLEDEQVFLVEYFVKKGTVLGSKTKAIEF